MSDPRTGDSELYWGDDTQGWASGNVHPEEAGTISEDAGPLKADTGLARPSGM